MREKEREDKRQRHYTSSFNTYSNVGERRDPSKRLGAEGVEKVREHSFFGSVVWKR